MTKATDNKLGALMQGLIYPAFLGAAFVWALTRFADQYQHASGITPLLSSVENYFAVWLLLYFCAPFLILTKTELPNPYNKLSFMLDIGDVIVIFIAFFNLGFVSNTGTINLEWVYWAIAAIPILAGLGNFSVGRSPSWWVSLFALAITIPMALWLNVCVILNWVAVTLLFVVLYFYFKDLNA